VRKPVVFDRAPDGRCYRGELGVGEVNCWHDSPPYFMNLSRRACSSSFVPSGKTAAILLERRSLNRSRRRRLQANDPQDYPDDGDEEDEPNRFDDQLLEPLRGQSIPPPGAPLIDRVGTTKSDNVWAFSLTGVETPGSGT
jgi:hypothetical protein